MNLRKRYAQEFKLNTVQLIMGGIILEKCPNTEEIPLNSFVESPLLTKDRPSSSSSWC